LYPLARETFGERVSPVFGGHGSRSIPVEEIR
jgi:hypothetical protein